MTQRKCTTIPLVHIRQFLIVFLPWSVSPLLAVSVAMHSPQESGWGNETAPYIWILHSKWKQCHVGPSDILITIKDGLQGLHLCTQLLWSRAWHTLPIWYIMHYAHMLVYGTGSLWRHGEDNQDRGRKREREREREREGEGKRTREREGRRLSLDAWHVEIMGRASSSQCWAPSLFGCGCFQVFVCFLRVHANVGGLHALVFVMQMSVIQNIRMPACTQY